MKKQKGTVKTSSGFVGFGGVVVDETPSKRLDAEVELLFRACGKKEAITKMKALQGISERAQQAAEGSEEVELMLDAWVAIVPALVRDPEYRVRVEAFRTFGALAQRVDRRALQKRFRLVLAHWLVAFFDSVPEVAAAARAAFPIKLDKYAAALLHYRDDLVATVLDSFLTSTPASLVEGRSFLTEEDSQAIWQNLIASSLHFLVHLSQETKDTQFLSSEKITKLFANETPSVRAACLSVIGFSPERFAEHGKLVFDSVFDGKKFKTIGERPQNGLETVVKFLTAVPASWKVWSWPRMLTWLKGASPSECALVLPILAQAPPEAFKEPMPKFADTLYASFWEAASRSKVRVMAADILGHTVDCLSFLAAKYKSACEEHVIVKLLAPLVTFCLKTAADFPCTPLQFFSTKAFQQVYARLLRQNATFWQALDTADWLPQAVADWFSAFKSGGVVVLPLIGHDSGVQVLEAYCIRLVASGDGTGADVVFDACRIPVSNALWEAAERSKAFPLLIAMCGEGESFAKRADQLVRAVDDSDLLPLLTSLSDAQRVDIRSPVLDERLLKLVSQGPFAAQTLLEAALRLPCALTEQGVQSSFVRCVAEKWPDTLAHYLAEAGRALKLTIPASLVVRAVLSGRPLDVASLSVDDQQAVRDGCASVLRTGARGAVSAARITHNVCEREWWAALAKSSTALTEPEAAICLELLVLHAKSDAGASFPDSAVAEDLCKQAVRIGVSVGWGRTEEEEDNAGFHPRQGHEQIYAACGHLAEVRSDIRDLATRTVVHVNPAANAEDLSGLLRSFVALVQKPFTSWEPFDRAVAQCQALLASPAELTVSEAAYSPLAGLLTHRCWQVQSTAATLLCRWKAEALLTKVVCELDAMDWDAWSYVIAWWALLSSHVEQQGHNTKRFPSDKAFSRFAEDVFAFILPIIEDASAAGSLQEIDFAAPVSLSDGSLRPQSAVDRAKLAGHLWFRALMQWRASARPWYSDLQDKRLSTNVHKFSQQFLCPVISATELRQVEVYSKAGGEENCSLSVGKRSVTACVEKDDVAVEITITLPPLYPLQIPEINLTRGNLSESLMRRWMLSLRILMSTEGRTLTQACQAWAKNASQYFEGVESCHICFCVLSEDGALPKLRCANCNCAFHPECLARWFSTSHVSKCCMCQLPWQGKRD